MYINIKGYLSCGIIFINMLSIGCNPIKSKVTGLADMQTISAHTGKLPAASSKDKVQPDNLGDFSHLLPIKILQAKARSVYEKYGIDLNGNCYECDLAAFRFNKKYFEVVNICDKNDFYREEKFTYTRSPVQLVVTIKNTQFVFTKIDGGPVYELKIQGDKIILKKKKFSVFYTPEKELKKFRQHDCGDFEG